MLRTLHHNTLHINSKKQTQPKVLFGRVLMQVWPTCIKTMQKPKWVFLARILIWVSKTTILNTSFPNKVSLDPPNFLVNSIVKNNKNLLTTPNQIQTNLDKTQNTHISSLHTISTVWHIMNTHTRQSHQYYTQQI